MFEIEARLDISELLTDKYKNLLGKPRPSKTADNTVKYMYYQAS